MKVKVIKMANTNKRYEPEFKKKMVRLVLEEGRTIASVNKEYNLGEGTVRSWIRQFETDQELNESTLDYVIWLLQSYTSTFIKWIHDTV